MSEPEMPNINAYVGMIAVPDTTIPKDELRETFLEIARCTRLIQGLSLLEFNCETCSTTYEKEGSELNVRQGAVVEYLACLLAVYNGLVTAKPKPNDLATSEIESIVRKPGSLFVPRKAQIYIASPAIVNQALREFGLEGELDPYTGAQLIAEAFDSRIHPTVLALDLPYNQKSNLITITLDEAKCGR